MFTIIFLALTQLENGLRVVSELSTSPLASITVAVKAGSRFETLESSGVSNFISKLNLRVCKIVI